MKANVEFVKWMRLESVSGWTLTRLYLLCISKFGDDSLPSERHFFATFQLLVLAAALGKRTASIFETLGVCVWPDGITKALILYNIN